MNKLENITAVLWDETLNVIGVAKNETNAQQMSLLHSRITWRTVEQSLQTFKVYINVRKICNPMRWDEPIWCLHWNCLVYVKVFACTLCIVQCMLVPLSHSIHASEWLVTFKVVSILCTLWLHSRRLKL